MAKEKILVAWAGGIQSAVNLFETKSPDYKIRGLVSWYSDLEKRLPEHLTRIELLEAQAASLELPLTKMGLPDLASLGAQKELQDFRKSGGQGVAFGSVSSESQKKEFENVLSNPALHAAFPLWKWRDQEVLRVFLGLGYKAIVTGVNLKKLPLDLLGKNFDQDFVRALPSSVSPIGENGEFHTFVYDGPFFQRRIEYVIGDRIERPPYACLDLRPVPLN